MEKEKKESVSVDDAAIWLIIFAESGCRARPSADTFQISPPTVAMGQTSFLTFLGAAGTYDLSLSLTQQAVC